MKKGITAGIEKSLTNNSIPVRIDVSQDVSAPSAVAGRSELMPDRAPLTPYTGGLGTTLGGPAAVDATTGSSSVSRLSFEDLLVTIRVLESSGGYVPDSFLDSLRRLVVFSSDRSFAVSGDSHADTVSSFRVRASDPLNPTPVSSRDGIVLYRSCVTWWVSLPRPFPPPPPLHTSC